MVKGDIRVVRDRRLAAALNFLEAWAALHPSRMTFWWSVMVKRVLSSQ